MKAFSSAALIRLGVIGAALAGMALWRISVQEIPPPLPLELGLELQASTSDSPEPLIITGEKDVGDFFYLKRTSASTFSLCYNSWGVPEIIESKPITWQTGKTLQLKIEMPSLPAGDDIKAAQGVLRIQCDGVTVLDQPVHFYTRRPGRIAFAQNPFGPVLCGLRLQGGLFLADGRRVAGGAGALGTPLEKTQAWIATKTPEAAGLLFLAMLALFHEKLRQKPRSAALLMRELQRSAGRLKAGYFLAGTLVALLGLSLAGKKVAGSFIFENYQRIHRPISPDSDFYPSAGAVANTARASRRPGQTLVIVGGNSVLRGVGQKVGDLWTGQLQKELGPDFCVVNLALNGGPSAGGAGRVAADILRKEGEEVVFVTNTFPGMIRDPDDPGVYGYLFWDAKYQKLLDENPVLDRYLAQRRLSPAQTEDLQKTQIAMRLNSLFHSLDFWNYFTYRHFGTTWSSLVSPFYAPRIILPDTEGPVALDYRDNPSSVNSELALVRSHLDEFHRHRITAHPRPQETALAGFEAAARQIFSDRDRKNTVMIMSGYSPFFRKLLAPDEEKGMQAMYRLQDEAIRNAGFHLLDSTAFLQETDFIDRCHLNADGGRKLARMLAREIKTLGARPDPIKP